MNNPLELTIPGKPQSQERPRLVVRPGRRPWVYSPSSGAQKDIAKAALAGRVANGASILQGEIAIKATFWGMGPKQDLSNVFKLYEDAMNKIIYEDDVQVSEIHAYRRRDEEDKPRAVLTVWAI